MRYPEQAKISDRNENDDCSWDGSMWSYSSKEYAVSVLPRRKELWRQMVAMAAQQYINLNIT